MEISATHLEIKKPLRVQGELNFYNTINQDGEPLKDSKISVSKQGLRVLLIMKAVGIPMTPYEVLNEYAKQFPACLVTSIRRAMTNLTNTVPQLLIKTAEMKMERYGKPNYKWKIA